MPGKKLTKTILDLINDAAFSDKARKYLMENGPDWKTSRYIKNFKKMKSNESKAEKWAQKQTDLEPKFLEDSRKYYQDELYWHPNNKLAKTSLEYTNDAIKNFNPEKYKAEMISQYLSNHPVNAVFSPNNTIVTRYHSTSAENIPSILKEGLTTPSKHPDKSNGFNRLGEEGYIDAVFTSGRKSFGHKGEPQIVMEIPKEKYVQMKKFRENPVLGKGLEHRQDVLAASMGDKRARSMAGIQEGGRVDMFGEDIPPEYIKKICTGDRLDECYSPEEWLNKLKGEQ